MFVYESVPGTSVFDFEETDVRTEFEVEGFEDTQITLELEAEQEYEVFVDDALREESKKPLERMLELAK